jgi:hypothetical protein
MLDLTVMQEDFYYEQCVAMMRKSSPYTNKVSQFIGRLHESGLLLAWETQVGYNSRLYVNSILLLLYKYFIALPSDLRSLVSYSG